MLLVNFPFTCHYFVDQARDHTPIQGVHVVLFSDRWRIPSIRPVAAPLDGVCSLRTLPLRWVWNPGVLRAQPDQKVLATTTTPR